MNDTGRYGRALRRLRKERGVSQEELARLTGTDRSHLSKVENGRVDFPQADTRERFAAALGMSDVDVLRNAGLTDAGGRILRILGPGELREEPEESDDAIDPDEYAVRTILRELPNDDRALLVAVAETFARRHRERYE